METRSLDDVILKMWQQFGQAEIALPRNSYRSHRVGSWNKLDFFKRYVDGTEELPFNQYLEPLVWLTI